MIKAIIFDCFGVLIADVIHTKADELAHAEPEVADLMYGVIRRADLGLISRQQAHAEIADVLHMTPEEVDTMSDQGEVRNVALIEQIAALRDRYKTGLLSNINGRESLEERFLPGELDRTFDQVMASGDVHMVKPNPAIYELMAERLGVQPNECVMIDDRQPFIDGAVAVGMHGIRYQNNTQVLDDLHTLLAS